LRKKFYAPLSDHLGSGADRDISSAQTQWGVSISDGAAGVSESNDLATVSFAHGARSSRSFEKVARKDTFPHESETQAGQKVIFDLDSTVLSLYGKQEHAAIG